MGKEILFPRRSFLAVVGDDDTFWICRTAQIVYKDKKSFDIQWLEEVPDQPDVFAVSRNFNHVELQSVIQQVKRMKKEKGNRFRLLGPEKVKIQANYELIQDPDWAPDWASDTEQSLSSENEEDEESDNEKGEKGTPEKKKKLQKKVVKSSSSEDEEDTDPPPKKKKKKKPAKASAKKKKVVAAESGEDDEEKVEEDDEEDTKKKRKTATKKKPVAKKVKKEQKPKKEKKPKAASRDKKPPKVKKAPLPKGPRPPNWRVKPNPAVKTVWEKDPFFEMREVVPFVSSINYSKLLFRAVAKKDNALLKQYIADREHIHSLSIKKSMADNMTPLDYAVKMENIPAMKILHNAMKEDGKGKKKRRVGAPTCMMATVGTGTYNWRSLGIKKIRKLNMSRGGREGNNALVKDVGNEFGSGPNETSVMYWGVSMKTINELLAMGLINKHSLIDSGVVDAIAAGHTEVPATLIEKDLKQNTMGSQFNHFHHEALTRGNAAWKGPIREVSCRKQGPSGLTPMHCAIINSNLSAFKQLYAICPDVNIADHNHRKLVHYAAAATTVNGLKFLSNNGANLEDIDKEGKTPLMLACDTGRAHNVEFILSTLKAKNGGDIATNPLLKKMGIGGLNRPDKSSWCAIHYAVDENRIDVVKVLVKYEANFEKQLNANLGKVTPLMMAAANGDLEMVKLLVNHAKIEKHDRYKRTALTHAVMNGSAHVASFLLSMGANPNKLDTSGNSNLHYACAYGWYFCMKTLLEAGAEVNACNEWKLTPVAVSLLKGHVGISKFLLDQPGVDINFKDDKGRTVILSMLAEVNNEKRLTEELYSEIVDMVERRGADAKVIDNDKNNALHFLCSYNTVPCLEAGVSLKKEWLENKKLLEKFVKFFIKKGASVLQLNTSFMLPFNNAQVRVDSFSRKNYQILNILTDAMNSAAKGHDAPKLEFEKNKANPLHAYLNDLSFVGIEEEFELFKSLMVCFNSLNKKGLIAPHMDTLIEGTQSSKDGKTPFMVLCNGYAGIQLKSSFHHSIKNEDHALDLYPDLKLNDKDELEGYSDRIGIFTDFIQYMVDLGVNLVVEVPTESTYNGRKVVRNVLVSSFLTLVSASIPIKEYPSRLAYEIVMPKESRIDLTDINGKTSLNRSVIAQDIELSTRLLKLRANVNHAYESTEKQTIDKENHVFLKYSPLLDAVRNGNRDMIKLLLNNNADVHLASTKVKAKDGEYYQKNLINVATDKCMSSRGNKVYQAILRDLLDAGTDINILDKITKRNVLHQAINNSSDSSDQSLDLEIALLRNKCDIFAKDIRQRFPLHYAFVKVGQHRESRRIDPIEVCSMVVEAMGSKRVDEPDEFGSTPLHYAAYRGATVSCLLLLQKGADINAVDKHGNTPLAYSVLGKHEGCALILLQKGANVNVDIVPLANPGESGADESEKSPEEQFRYLPIHFMPKSLNKPYSLFQGVILNDWLGITYMTLQQLEVFGMSYAMAIHVALANGKIQFAKTLIAKQVSVEKLKQKVEQKRNLIHCLANECKSGDRSDIQVDILELLLQADVSPAEKDVHGCSPLHYACKNQNLELIKVLLKEDRVIRSINVMNNLEISPFGAIFWNMVSKQSNFSDIIKVMLENGADPDVVMPFKPISYLQSGYTIQSKNKTGFEEFKDMLKITPLICSVVHRDEDLIELLLNNKHKVCNINLEDEKGMTPLMHAAKTNDILIAKQLIYNNGIKINKVDPLVLTPHLNINASDLDGYNAINHIIELDINAPIRCTFDNPKMFELLETIGVKIKPIITPDGNSRTPKDVAAEVGAINLHKKMSGVLAKTASTIPWISGAKGIEVPHVNDGIVWEDEFNFDIKKDSKKMLKRLEIEATKELERKKKEALEAGRSLDSLEMEIDANGVDSEEEEEDDPEPMEEDNEEDSDENSDDEEEDDNDNGTTDKSKKKDELTAKPNGCIVGDGSIHDGYTVLMTKVDVSFGAWGMYNFYRMQIWKEKHKDLWVLFTNWGRIGGYDQGQYQNTPYGTAEQAVEEFEKIFKAKSGNEWSERANFEVKPKKYRLVNVNHLQRVKKDKIKFDLETEVPSKLPETVQDMLVDVANVSLYMEAYKEIGGDHEAVPFGRIKRSTVEKAKDILVQLETLVKDKGTIEQKRASNNTEALTQRLFDTVDEISKLSSDYYHLMPKKGFEYVRLPPIDNEHVHGQEMLRVLNTLEFETAERLLLGAMYRKKELNPLDYIYRAMGCHIESLKPDDPESAHIMQYIYNSPTAQSHKIEGIFKLRRPEEEKHFGSSLKSNSDLSRCLLWHGSKAANLMSIFTNGLMVNAPYAPVTGKAFGNGLYTANVYEKSFNYTYDWRSSKWAGSKYMLLCDVARGKRQKITEYQMGSVSYPQKGYDSVHAIGRQIPDTIHTIKLKSGMEIPLGQIVMNEKPETKKAKKNHWGWYNNNQYIVDHDEFVTFDNSQASLRYVVQIQNGNVSQQFGRFPQAKLAARKRQTPRKSFGGKRPFMPE